MKTLKKTAITIVMIIAVNVAFSQAPPDPPGDPTGDGSTPVGDGGGAPIGGGVAMLLAMGAAYGGKKVYDYRKKIRNEMTD